MTKIEVVVPSNENMQLDYPLVRIGRDVYNLNYYELIFDGECGIDEPNCSRFTHD